MSTLMHYGKKGMKLGVRKAVKADSSLTDKATLNKAKMERQDLKEQLDQARANVKNKPSNKRAIALNSKKGRERTLRYAEVNYKMALEREKRIKNGGRSAVEKIIDRSNLSVADLIVSATHEVKDD